MGNFVPLMIRDVRAAEERSRFSAISLFAGGGGSSSGLKLAGANIRAAVEFSPWAATSYRRNYPNTPVLQANVRSLVQNEGVAKLLETARLSVGELDYLDSSPPCQPHSSAGRGIGDPDQATSHSGVRQYGAATLPFVVAELAHLVQPKVSVMENVVGLVRRTPEFFGRILQAIRYSGGIRRYFADWRVLSSAHFGVPQNRPRLFVIAVRTDIADRASIRSDDDVLSLFPAPTVATPVIIRDALIDLKQSEGDAEPFFTSFRRSRLADLIGSLPKCPVKPTRLSNVRSYYTLTRCSWDHPSPTLVIAGQKPDGLSGALHPSEDRKFTVPELKRLFGLPDDYLPAGSVSEAVDTICNMVPPLMTKAIADNIYDLVLSRNASLQETQK